MKFSLKEITEAYQKAKADAWLRHDLSEEDFLWYEQKYYDNVKEFQSYIMHIGKRHGFDAGWLGGWRLMAKKIILKQVEEDADMSIFSDPKESFNLDKVDKVMYRIMAKPSVNFQILSSLWILKVGWKYDYKLLPNVYGNRLRSTGKRTSGPNVATRGSFRCYRPMFTKWKRDGISALAEVLKHGKAIVVTADAKAFFHSIKPDFLLDEGYLSNNGIVLTLEERELTKILIDAISKWAESTPLKTGLPVGLAASSVIANAALLDFDAAFENMGGKVFYGRYVDDLLFVFRDKCNVRTRSDVWECIAKSSPKLIPITADKHGKTFTVGVKFVPAYVSKLTDNEVLFKGDKCRAFFLDKLTGPSFVATLEDQIKDITSEFRYLPKNIFDEDDIEQKIQKLLTKDGEEADNFRKIDILTLRKKDMKELLREMRFLLKSLPPNCWKTQRVAFYELVRKHLFVPPALIDYAERDFPQIVSMAVQCGDFVELESFLGQIYKVCESLSKRKCWISGATDVAIGFDEVVSKWQRELFSTYAWSMKTAFRDVDDSSYNRDYDAFVQKSRGWFCGGLQRSLVAKVFVRQCVLHDLSAHSYIEHLYRNDVRPFTCHADKWRCSQLGFADLTGNLKKCFAEKFVDAVSRLGGYVSWPRKVTARNVPYALIFPTRPIGERDLVWIGDGRMIDNVEGLFDALRGYVPKFSGVEPVGNVSHGAQIELRTIANPGIVNPTIALLNMKTDEVFCCDQIKMVEPAVYYDRFKNVIAAINAIIEQKKHVDYLVMHELSIPLRWFSAIAGHCADHGISVIAGTSYHVTDRKKRRCKNELWMSLVRRTGNFCQPEFLCEAKKEFARQEEYLLRKNFKYSIDDRMPACGHAVIRHGEFAFSTLICSELTSIAARSRLRGLIDALFILAWNKDVHSFASIIESAAADLHAYIVQSNNNIYGDNRVRIPAREEWGRDVVRLRGGKGEFCVLEKLDVSKLRKFQLNWNASVYYGKKPPKDLSRFKPIPIGYEYDIAIYRKKVPREVVGDGSV